MTEINTHGDLFPIDETICKVCAYRMSRLIIPLELDDFGISEEDLKDIELNDDDEIMIEQHTCLIVQEDLGYLVKECTHFKDKRETSLFTSNPY
jgi:hypothetical protein